MIEATRNAELRLDADVALENLSVVSDAADDADNPVLGQSCPLAETALGAGEASDLRLVGPYRLVDRRLTYCEAVVPALSLVVGTSALVCIHLKI